MGNTTSKSIKNVVHEGNDAFSLLLEILLGEEMSEPSILLLHTPIQEIRQLLPSHIRLPTCFCRDLTTLRNVTRALTFSQSEELLRNQIAIYALELVRPIKSILAILQLTVHHFFSKPCGLVVEECLQLIRILYESLWKIVEASSGTLTNPPRAEAWLVRVKCIELLLSSIEKCMSTKNSEVFAVIINSLNTSPLLDLVNQEPEWNLCDWISQLALVCLGEGLLGEANLFGKTLSVVTSKTTCSQLLSFISISYFLVGLSTCQQEEEMAVSSLVDFVTMVDSEALRIISSPVPERNIPSTTLEQRKLAVLFLLEHKLFQNGLPSFKSRLCLSLLSFFPQEAFLEDNDNNDTPSFTITYENLLLSGVNYLLQEERWIEAHQYIQECNEPSTRLRLLEMFWSNVLAKISTLQVGDMTIRKEEEDEDKNPLFISCALLPWSVNDQESIVAFFVPAHPLLVVRWHLCRDNYVAAAEYLHDLALDGERATSAAQRYARLQQCENAIKLAQRAGQKMPREWPLPLPVLLTMARIHSSLTDTGMVLLEATMEGRQRLLVGLLERGMMAQFMELYLVAPDEWTAELFTGFIVDRLERYNNHQSSTNILNEGTPLSTAEMEFDLRDVPVEIIQNFRAEELWLWYFLYRSSSSLRDTIVYRAITLLTRNLDSCVPNWLLTMLNGRYADAMLRLLGETGQLEAVATLLQRPDINHHLSSETALYLDCLVSTP